MGGRLGSAFNSAKRWSDDRSLFVDIALACLIGVFALVDAGGNEEALGSREPTLAAYLLVAAGAVALIWRRRAPIAVLIVVVALLTAWYGTDHGSFLSVLGLSALYAVATHGQDRRRAWIAISVAFVILMAVGSLTLLDHGDGFSYLNAISMSAYLIGAVGAGLVIRNRHRIFIDTQERAAAAESDQAAAAERAVTEERARIAREMHDVVAHGMSVIVVQAAAAQETAHEDPDKAVKAMENIERVGRESLTEMRRMLGVLRGANEVDASLSPQPRLADIETIVAQAEDSDITTELEITGQKRDLPPGIELAAFRIVQEALTNVRKHAGQSTSVHVGIAYEPEAIAIEITDDGRGAVSSLSGSGAGNGLIGMRERVDIYGGAVTAGPQAGGGYRVRALLPVTDAESRPTVASNKTSIQVPSP